MTEYPQYPVRPASLQEAFDAAALHILQTKKPSFVARGTGCAYSGIGCAMRPFLPQDADGLRYLDGQGALEDIQPEDREEFLTPFIEENLEFFMDLQNIHDRDATRVLRGQLSSAEWFSGWAAKMKSLAAHWNLDASLLDDALAL